MLISSICISIVLWGQKEEEEWRPKKKTPPACTFNTVFHHLLPSLISLSPPPFPSLLFSAFSLSPQIWEPFFLPCLLIMGVFGGPVLLSTLILRCAPNSWHRGTGERSTKMSQASRHLHHKPGCALVARFAFSLRSCFIWQVEVLLQCLSVFPPA